MLDDIRKRNLFLIPLDTEGRWFRYQHLFAEVLYALLERDYPGEAGALHLKAAAWFESEGFPGEAVDHALHSGDMQRVKDLIFKHWISILHRGEVATVLRWLDALPKEIERNDPSVSLAIGRKGLEPVFRFVEQAGAKPWFVWYAPMLPHSPHTPPDDLLQKYLKLAPTESVARYWACVEWFDRTCGELLGYLDRTGRRTNTIVVYTADNGCIPAPEQKDRFAPRSKSSPYEGGVRTPIMVSCPGRLEPGRDREHLASNIDIWPTLAALLRTPLPRGLPGVDLTDRNVVAKRSAIYGEQYAHNIADIDPPTLSLEHRWIIVGWWKLVSPDPRNIKDQEAELYNLQDDPWEKSNLADKEPERARSLQRQLDASWTPTPGTARSDESSNPGGETLLYKRAGDRSAAT